MAKAEPETTKFTDTAKQPQPEPAEAELAALQRESEAAAKRFAAGCKQEEEVWDRHWEANGGSPASIRTAAERAAAELAGAKRAALARALTRALAQTFGEAKPAAPAAPGDAVATPTAPVAPEANKRHYIPQWKLDAAPAAAPAAVAESVAVPVDPQIWFNTALEKYAGRKGERPGSYLRRLYAEMQKAHADGEITHVWEFSGLRRRYYD
jgi:hypothetical protein